MVGIKINESVERVIMQSLGTESAQVVSDESWWTSSLISYQEQGNSIQNAGSGKLFAYPILESEKLRFLNKLLLLWLKHSYHCFVD